ncbi:fatty acid oxidation complex subunit alpha FadB [Granulosicoccus antarcticus]|uniref:enoyl-CoA hydratase n=1 Tax=Granulosicoccus antarcticus IMCC3135 TaxID=1192854 RepID=A0A2Z2P4Q6_9GAMM|nr:fatty acid oxidation complex subunit alpha FadB [Granulosicoccus antarcticus]ASJ76440.1 Fatty acid oxidation complex subunit alpha [Granulosicoccus antarcticus IMCC3135]
MLFTGAAFKLTRDNDILELCFDSEEQKVNVFNRKALAEFGEVLAVIEQQTDVAGLVLTSSKGVFVAGADITEFLGYFAAEDAVLETMLKEVNSMFNRFEDLPFPTVAAINGEAQGGGFEISLACDFRVAAPTARMGLPEVKLGIMPGWGGSVRLPRLIGVDNAVEWMCTGASKKASAALADGAIDAVVHDGDVRAAAIAIIEQVRAGKLDAMARRSVKIAPLALSEMERTMAFESAKGVVGAQAGPHYPSPLTIVNTVAKHASKSRDEALPIESASFVKLAKTDVAESLVGIFLNDQALKRLARKQSKDALPVKHSAVLGAGIMGGGIAYQSASNGVSITMKDIREEALEAGLDEAGKLLKKQIQRGKLKPEGMATVLNAIQPALSYGEFGKVDLVVEAVVENPKVKMSVLTEVEAQVSDDTIITTNTSTISVDLLSTALKRPENFCGMHFFNPVHRMPLVEVIRAKTSSEQAIATTVAYALAMRKTPIVVNDCPGFLINRILFAYFGGFNKLVADGGDFMAIDKALERFGWPMGPAYLLDVVGMDTGKHAAGVMAEGFPDRMASESKTIIDALFDAERLGQKNGKGFYKYEVDRKGKPQKLPDPDVAAVIDSVQSAKAEISAEDMVDRLMIPMCIEAARCLEDDIVGAAFEVDMGLVYGVGFPPFRGGALHHVDKIGLAAFCERADQFAELGPLYHPTESMREMAKTGKTFYTKISADKGASA